MLFGGCVGGGAFSRVARVRPASVVAIFDTVCGRFVVWYAWHFVVLAPGLTVTGHLRRWLSICCLILRTKKKKKKSEYSSSQSSARHLHKAEEGPHFAKCHAAASDCLSPQLTGTCHWQEYARKERHSQVCVKLKDKKKRISYVNFISFKTQNKNK